VLHAVLLLKRQKIYTVSSIRAKRPVYFAISWPYADREMDGFCENSEIGCFPCTLYQYFSIVFWVHFLSQTGYVLQMQNCNFTVYKPIISMLPVCYQ